MMHQIKHWSGRVLFECEVPQDVPSGLATRHALEKAVAEKEGMVGELEGDLTAAEEARDAAVLSLKASKTQNKIEVAAIEEARDAAVRALETSGSSLEEYKADTNYSAFLINKK